MKKGYNSEYLAKKILSKKYGKSNVIKASIGQGMDYIVLKAGRLSKFVECKEYVGKKKYYSQREKLQIARIKKLAKRHKCKFEIWKRKKHSKKFEIERIL